MRGEAGRRAGLNSLRGMTCGYRRIPWVMISYGDIGVDRYGDEGFDRYGDEGFDRKINQKEHTGTLGAKCHVELKL